MDQLTPQLIGNVLLFWSATAATLSVTLHARVPWRTSRVGRHLMAYMLAIAAVLDLGCIRVVIGDSHTFQVIRLVTFVGVPIVLTWRLWIQWDVQRSAQGDTDHQAPTKEQDRDPA